MKTSASLDSRDQYEKAAAILAAFAERTGLTGKGPERPYLWTDAVLGPGAAPLMGSSQRATIFARTHDINEVMLASALAPDGFLVLQTTFIPKRLR